MFRILRRSFIRYCLSLDFAGRPPLCHVTSVNDGPFRPIIWIQQGYWLQSVQRDVK